MDENVRVISLGGATLLMEVNQEVWEENVMNEVGDDVYKCGGKPAGENLPPSSDVFEAEKYCTVMWKNIVLDFFSDRRMFLNCYPNVPVSILFTLEHLTSTDP